MDNLVNSHVQGWEGFEDDVSLSFDRPVEDTGHSVSVSSRTSFEFHPVLNSQRNHAGEDVIIFCGRIMNLKTQESVHTKNTLPDQRDSLVPLRSSSQLSRKPGRSQSFHFEKPPPLPQATTGGSFRYESSVPKNHRAFIGLAKVPPEMELRDMKRRQGRRVPAPMFPPDGEVGATNGGGRKSHKSRVKTLKCRTPSFGMLSMALLGCVPNV